MKLKYIFILLLTTAFAHQAFAQSKPGFVQQENIKVAGILADSQIDTLSVTRKQTTRSYYDGLGRGIQTIGVQASPLQNDLIQPVAYDNLGRQTIGYLPYAGQSTDTMGSYRSNAISTNQPAFYNQTTQYLIATDAAPYTQSVFENSPLQRLLQAGTVGSGFQPVSGQHYKTVSYRPNNSTPDGNILVWNPDGTFTTGNYYANNALAVTDGKDEDNTETLSFTDLAGHTILKRQILSSGNLDTYYIYDNAGMINYIIPPKAMALMVTAGSYNLNTVTGVNKLIFHFIYDTMGRLTKKTVPAKGVMYIVYDPVNRPVLMQDSNMRVSDKWNYIKYDSKGRVISQGIYVDASHTTLSTMQTYVSGLSYASAWGESRSSGGTTTGYYTNSIFPTTGTTPLAYAYYDDYDLLQNGSPYTYGTQGLTGEIGATTAKIKGAPTMEWQTTVGAGLSGTWLLKVTFYDKRGNPIQTQSNNHVYYVNSTTLTDTATMVPDFMGVPQISKVKKQSTSSISVKVQTTLTYDHMYRIQTVSQQYNGGAVVKLANYNYNELGQVYEKNLGFVSGTTYLQNVNMRFNIRGQLLNINNSKLANDTGKTSSDTNDLFGMQMLYDKTDSKLSNTPYYNGKLSAVKWMSKDGNGASSYERAFKYYYDVLNRDTAAIYAERTTASTSNFTTTNGWNENRITYDQNGNLLTLFRDSTSQGSGGHTPIDNLTYTYDTNNPDQLKTVTDGTGTSYKNSGFRNYTGSSGNYAYDGNGNLKTDPYKGLNISYDVLNHTDTIKLSGTQYITYTYDASGNLIRKQAYKSGTTTQITDYIDGFVYNNASGTEVLTYFAMPEGRVMYSSGSFTQEYIITDQQGNARISFNNTGAGGIAKVVQENSYYAFGLIMPGAAVTSGSNRNLYNGGSEWQNDYSNLPDYYQTYYRNYDAAIGRWIGVDPLAEEAEGMTSYQYADNNPIVFNDPLGDTQRPLWTGGYNTQSAGFTQFNSNPSGGNGDPFAGFEQDLAGDAAMAAQNQYQADLVGDGGYSTGKPEDAAADQVAAVAARAAAGLTAGATPGGLAAQINSAIQPYAAGLDNSSVSVNRTSNGYALEYNTRGPDINYSGNGLNEVFPSNINHLNYISADPGGGGLEDVAYYQSFNLKKVGAAFVTNIVNTDDHYGFLHINIYPFYIKLNVVDVILPSIYVQVLASVNKSKAQDNMAKAWDFAREAVYRDVKDGTVTNILQANKVFLDSFRQGLGYQFHGNPFVVLYPFKGTTPTTKVTYIPLLF